MDFERRNEMINVGDKFVIKIGDIFEKDGENLYRVKGFKSLVFDENGLKKLVTLEEVTKEEMEAARCDGMNEVWELVKFLDKTRLGEIGKIFDVPEDESHPISWIFTKNVYDVLNKYKDWKKNESKKISVGDIVKRKSGDTAVVISRNDVFVKCLTSDGLSTAWLKSDCIKTERHIDIESILKQIKE